jgi:hypothetical protein
MDYIYKTEKQENGDYGFSIYLPARCAVVLEKQKAVRAAKTVKTEEKAVKAEKKTAKTATKTAKAISNNKSNKQ